MISQVEKNIIQKILMPFNPKMVGIFGSFSRNEETIHSDIDILVDLEKEYHLLDLIGLEQELSEILGRKVDLITLRSIESNLLPYIQKDLIRLI